MKRITGKVAKKKEKKKISIKFIILFLIMTLVISLIALKSLCTIRKIDITIEGVHNDKITKEQIMSLSNLKVGDKLYKDLRSEIIARVEKNPYVKDVNIKRNFSGELKISVTQREVQYLINYAGEYIYIDKEGYILEINKENNGKTIIIGLSTDCSNLSIGNTKIRLNSEDLEKIEVVNNIMFALNSNGIKNKINTIDVNNKDDFVLQLDEEHKIVHIGNGNDLNTRVLYMKKILEVENEHNGIIYVNGNLDESYVYFKEQ